MQLSALVATGNKMENLFSAVGKVFSAHFLHFMLSFYSSELYVPVWELKQPEIFHLQYSLHKDVHFCATFLLLALVYAKKIYFIAVYLRALI